MQKTNIITKACFKALVMCVFSVLEMFGLLLIFCPAVAGVILLFFCNILNEQPKHNDKQEMQHIQKPSSDYDKENVINEKGSEAKDKYIIADLIKSIKLPGYPREVIFVEISETDLENLGRIVRTNSLNPTEQ